MGTFTQGLFIRPRWGRGPRIPFEPEELPLLERRSAFAFGNNFWQLLYTHVMRSIRGDVASPLDDL